MSAAEEQPSDGMVDGVTGTDDGGREVGDVELALFKRVPDDNHNHDHNHNHNHNHKAHPKSDRSYTRYLTDPLSMFAREAGSSSGDSPPPDTLTLRDNLSSAHVSTRRDAAKSKPPRGLKSARKSPVVAAAVEVASTAPPDPPVQTVNTRGGGGLEDEDRGSDTDASDGLGRYMGQGVAWRDAMVQACADLLGKTLAQLEVEYAASKAAVSAANTAFSSEMRSFEPMPRDLADFVIMSTLKMQDSFAMQNATSWLFNMMDRTGAGYVLREEFIRYAPFIGPVADTAVAGLVFDALVLEQARKAAEEEAAQRKGNIWSWGGRDKQSDSSKRSEHRNSHRNDHEERGSGRESREGLRARRGAGKMSTNRSVNESHSTSGDGARDVGNDSMPSNGHATTDGNDYLQRELYPAGVALRFETWRAYFSAIEDKYQYADDEWPKVKKLLGIDPAEILVKSQGALDHSDLFPTLGKIFLSQRYLIFFAAVGRNHYVARLGAVAEVSTCSIPLMMRDCIQIYLESEMKAALDGVTSASAEDTEDAGATDAKKDSKREEEKKDELTLSQYVGKHMRNFTARRKPLQFSLLEFRETRRRDNWMNLVKEMVEAHKLHVRLGFCSSGRIVPSVQVMSHNSTELLANSHRESDEKKDHKDDEKAMTENYHRSPFRNEPSPPLLAVAAHANIVRFRALRRVTQKRVSTSLFLFSHVERNSHLVNWYTDSVRAYNNDSGRSWIEKALATIRENMDTNDRMYRVHDSTPFDPQVLGDQIGRFAELCSPMARVSQSITYLVQWKNPSATILAILVCIVIAIRGWVTYVPAVLLVFQAAWIVETRNNVFGLGMGRNGFEDAKKRETNVLELVAQVHNTLEAAQNVLAGMNGELGKLQALFLWGAEEWQSWVAVGALCGGALILLVVPARALFLFFCFFMFFKHFLPPTNPGQRFWEGVPSRVGQIHEPKKRGGSRRRCKASTASIPSVTPSSTPSPMPEKGS